MNLVFMRLSSARLLGAGTQALPPKSDLSLLQQHRSAWAWEIEVRPWVEKF